MRVYISVDMEGIAGVVHESQTDPATPAFAAEYGRFRRLMTAEANAAVEGALAAGATRVLVNEAVSRHAAKSVAPAAACRMIREEVPRALKRAHVPFTLRAPVTLEVDFAMTIHADMAELCPGATRTAGRTVAFTHPDYGEVFRAWRTLLNLSAAV